MVQSYSFIFLQLQEEYILKWRDYQSNFFELAEDLFVNELLTDVTLCCRDQTFEAHRLVLSVCSTYFRSVFTSAQLRQRGGQGHPVIFIKDLDPLDLERLLQYMYYGEVKVPNCEMEAFIRAANQMNIRGLSSIGSMPQYSPPAQPPPPHAEAEAILSVDDEDNNEEAVEAAETSPPPPPTESVDLSKYSGNRIL